MIIANLVSPKTCKSFVQQNILAPVLSWDLKQRLCFKMQSVPPVALLQWYRHNNLPLDALQGRARFPVCLLLYFLINFGFAQYFQWHTFRHNSDNGGLSFPNYLPSSHCTITIIILVKMVLVMVLACWCNSVSSSVKWYNSVDIVVDYPPHPTFRPVCESAICKKGNNGWKEKGRTIERDL